MALAFLVWFPKNCVSLVTTTTPFITEAGTESSWTSISAGSV
jgi:hypothetical protein